MLLFLPAERVPIPADYGGAATGAVAAAAVDGPSVFAASCAQCHGFSGEGGAGPQIAGRFDGRASTAAKQVGGGGITMPAFRSKLTAAEIDAVAAYVASLR